MATQEQRIKFCKKYKEMLDEMRGSSNILTERLAHPLKCMMITRYARAELGYSKNRSNIEVLNAIFKEYNTLYYRETKSNDNK